MRPVETDVGTDEMRICVVLDECVNECSRSEPINELRSDQLRCESPVGQFDSIPVVCQIHRQVIVRFDGQACRDLLVVAVIKVAPAVSAVTRDLPPLIGGEVSCVIFEFVIALRDCNVRIA